MKIQVCALHELPGAIARYRPSHVLSLLDPDTVMDLPYGIAPTQWLRISFRDFEKVRSDAIQYSQIEEILAWAATLPKDAVLIVHCHMGISRSPATALAIYSRENGVEQAIDWIRKVRPESIPNRLMAAMYDRALGLNGQLYEVCQRVNDLAYRDLGVDSPAFIKPTSWS